MFLATDAVTLADWDVVARLAVAAGLGAAVGGERELRDREAGSVRISPSRSGPRLFTSSRRTGSRTSCRPARRWTRPASRRRS